MLNIDTINEEIKKLEECDCTTWGVCNKLATLYIVREHFNKTKANNYMANKTIDATLQNQIPTKI